MELAMTASDREHPESDTPGGVLRRKWVSALGIGRVCEVTSGIRCLGPMGLC